MPHSRTVSLVGFALLLACPLPAGAGPAGDDGPTLDEAEAVCRFIARTPAETRIRDYLLRYGRLDVNNDGVFEPVTRGLTGSMGGDAYSINDDPGSSFIPEPAEQPDVDWDELRWSLGAAWLPFGRYTYEVSFLDEEGHFLTYAAYIDRQNRRHVLCTFDNHVTEWLRPIAASDRDFCRQVTESTGKVYAPVSRDPSLEELWRVQLARKETSVKGYLDLDFDNDGRPERLLLLDFGSSAGPGCSLTYFDLAPASGDAPSDSGKQRLLWELQGVHDATEKYPGPTCGGNRPRWLEQGGKRYFENGYPRAAPRTDQQLFHDVRVIEAGKVREVCHGRFDVTASVREIIGLR